MGFVKRERKIDEFEFKCWRNETEFVIARNELEATVVCANHYGERIEDYLRDYGNEEWKAYERYEELTFVDVDGEWAECLKGGMKEMRRNDPLLIPENATISITAQAREWLLLFDDGEPHWLGSTEW